MGSQNIGSAAVDFLLGPVTIFTTRRSYASAVLGVVILSVRLSVRLSHACFVTNPKKLHIFGLWAKTKFQDDVKGKATEPRPTQTIPFSTFCIVFHIFVVSGDRDFKFGR